MALIETVLYGWGISKAVDVGMDVLGVRRDEKASHKVEEVERSQRPQVDPDAVSFVDHRGLRCFFPSVRLEILNTLRGARFFPVDGIGNVVSISPDPYGRPIPVEETAESWVRARNENALILAPYYIGHNIAARRFLRACLRSQAGMFAANGMLYVVLCEVGQAARLDTRTPPPKPVSKVDAPPSIVVPTVASIVAGDPPEKATVEVVSHEHPMPPPSNGANGHQEAALGGAVQETQEQTPSKKPRSRKRVVAGGE